MSPAISLLTPATAGGENDGRLSGQAGLLLAALALSLAASTARSRPLRTNLPAMDKLKLPPVSPAISLPTPATAGGEKNGRLSGQVGLLLAALALSLAAGTPRSQPLRTNLSALTNLKLPL